MSHFGWTETSFQLVSETDRMEELIIPAFLMKDCHLSHPIISFNDTEHILTRTDDTKHYNTVRKTFPSLKRNKVSAFIQTVRAEQICSEDKEIDDCSTV